MSAVTDIEYAVMIRTREHFTDDAIGLYTGSICLITGRPGYSGGNPPTNPPLNPVTANPQLVWKEGLIAKESLGSPEEVVDPTLGGGYSTMSGADLKLINNPPGLDGSTLFDYLNDIGINLFRCELQLYVVIDGTFKLWGTYSIENITNEEHLVSLTAVDGFLTIHKDTLKTEVSAAGFSEAPDDSIGKFIPLCMGRIPEAKLLPVTGQIVRKMLCGVGATSSAHTLCTSGEAEKRLLGNRDRIGAGHVETPVGEVASDGGIPKSDKWKFGRQEPWTHKLVRIVSGIEVPQISNTTAFIQILASGIKGVDAEKPVIMGRCVLIPQLDQLPRNGKLVEPWFSFLLVVLTQKTSDKKKGHNESKCKCFHDALLFTRHIIYFERCRPAHHFMETP